MRITCVLVAVFGVFEASALFTDNEFGRAQCDDFSINGGGSSLPPIQSPTVDALQYRFLDAITKPTRDSVKAAIKPQIRKELYSISPIKRFTQSSSPLTQAIPFTSGKKLDLPAFQFFPSDSITSGFFNEAQPSRIERTGSGIFSTNRPGSVNYERTIGGYLGDKSYPEVLNESFLGNSNGAVTEIDSSFLRNGGFLGDRRPLLPGPSTLERGIIKGYSSQGY